MTSPIFIDLLKEAGCTIDTDSSSVLFQVEPVLFRRHLGRKLRSQLNAPTVIEDFMESMQTVLEDVDMFRKCLLPSSLSNVPVSSRSSSDSLLKTLLTVDIVQPKTIVYLLERLPEFYNELENDLSSSCTPRLILHQLRWLEYIVEPEILTEKLIEIIEITPSVLQHELITSLPDIVNDSEHKSIVIYLKELMLSNSSLTVPILDTLSNLTLHSENLEDVRDIVLDRLESAEVDDLAILVKFLLQVVTAQTVDKVISGIRKKLDFRTLGKVQQIQLLHSTMGSSQKTHPSDTIKNSPEALILESIKLGLQFHKFVCDGWIKTLQWLEEPQEHKVLDVLVLFILSSMNSIKKKAESIFRKKIVSGCITEALLEETLLCHTDGLASYWNNIISLTEYTLRSHQKDSTIPQCASALYISTFKSCDAYYRQETVGLLVAHIGSNEAVEMNVALNVLLKLVTSDAKMCLLSQ
ncbi:Fanconi anaemia protein FANCD2 [Spinellus fusiger]|nr:Fanconi anaemia protein FANCD2 [Spinellus fusiger]